MQGNTYPLPEGWSGPEVLVDTVIADGVELRRAGLCSTGPAGEELTGAAVEAELSPVDRAYFELLERISTVDAVRTPLASYDLRTADGDCAGSLPSAELFPESADPARWRYARSNGVALHGDWRRASERAVWELAERDRVLRAWYGETRPERIALDLHDTPLRSSRTYEWRAYSFPVGREASVSEGVDVVGLFGIPSRSTAPLISGYGARPGQAGALDAAVREAMQLLGFLWDEPVIDRRPEPAPTPLYHLEYFQWAGHRDVLRRWLDVGHERHAPREAQRLGPTRPAAPRAGVAFVDLSPAWLPGGLRVAKAICDAAMPLVFGESPLAASLPFDLRTHPIG